MSLIKFLFDIHEVPVVSMTRFLWFMSTRSLRQIELTNLADPVTMAILPMRFAAMLGINPESIAREMLEKLFGMMVGRYVVTFLFQEKSMLYIQLE